MMSEGAIALDQLAASRAHPSTERFKSQGCAAHREAEILDRSSPRSAHAPKSKLDTRSVMHFGNGSS